VRHSLHNCNDSCNESERLLNTFSNNSLCEFAALFVLSSKPSDLPDFRRARKSKRSNNKRAIRDSFFHTPARSNLILDMLKCSESMKKRNCKYNGRAKAIKRENKVLLACLLFQFHQQIAQTFGRALMRFQKR